MTDEQIIDFGRECAERYASRLRANNAASFTRSRLCRLLEVGTRGERADAKVVEFLQMANLPVREDLALMINKDPKRVGDLLRLGVLTLPGDDEAP